LTARIFKAGQATLKVLLESSGFHFLNLKNWSLV
jgi:hypothetical protein